MLLDEKLKESEMRYRRLFETAQDGILILDFETGNIIDANPFIVKMIGYTLDQILGKKLWEIGLFSNMEQSELAFAELKRNNYIRFEDMPVVRKDGKINEVEFISNVYTANNTKVIQCNIRDITDRKKSEKALLESVNHIRNINIELVAAKAKSEESDNLKTSFLANMSHEIRTPMNAIVGFSELLLKPGISKEVIDRYVQIINSSSLQLLTIISDIVDISQIETGQITIESELVDINNLMNELFAAYTRQINQQKPGLHFICNLPREAIHIKTDGNRIKQILCNLLNNAIKFTNAGEIEFGYKVLKNKVEFFVKDTGIGIAPENHNIIFHRFRQVKTADNKLNTGNGLGLSISSALVQKLGGSISVNSVLGSGSVFSFTIPYLRNSNIMSKATKSKPDGFSNWNEKTVLIVEDDYYNHSYLEELFSGTNVKVLHAWNGKEAVAIVEKHQDISLVIMDIKLPVMDGLMATRIIKSIRPKLPVIAQTANALFRDRKLALDAGCDDYFAKPIETGVFKERIGAYLI